MTRMVFLLIRMWSRTGVIMHDLIGVFRALGIGVLFGHVFVVLYYLPYWLKGLSKWLLNLLK